MSHERLPTGDFQGSQPVKPLSELQNIIVEHLMALSEGEKKRMIDGFVKETIRGKGPKEALTKYPYVPILLAHDLLSQEFYVASIQQEEALGLPIREKLRRKFISTEVTVLGALCDWHDNLTKNRNDRDSSYPAKLPTLVLNNLWWQLEDLHGQGVQKVRHFVERGKSSTPQP